MTAGLEILDPGPLTTVQDLGRPGLSSWGVTISGAADRAALRLANRLVGNPEAFAGLEVTTGGMRLRAMARTLVSVTGGVCTITVDGRPAGHRCAVYLQPSQQLALGTTTRGMRVYVGVRGGIAVPPVLGSRATDVLSTLGPPVVARDDVLPVGVSPLRIPTVDRAPGGEPSPDPLPLRVRLGPRDDWFAPSALRSLLAARWSVDPASNRVGLRIRGPSLPRRLHEELPSEGVVRGSLQVPPAGLPTLFLADHPVTGGYPVIAVVVDADIDQVAQLRPGQRLRFVPLAPTTTRSPLDDLRPLPGPCAGAAAVP